MPISIPLLPERDSVVLPEHAEYEEPPTFIFRPITQRELARVAGKLISIAGKEIEEASKISVYHDAEDSPVGKAPEVEEVVESADLERLGDALADMSELFMGVFARHVIAIHHLDISGEEYNPANLRHLDSIPLRWQRSVGKEILERAQMSKVETGKSSSPSGSEKTTHTSVAPSESADSPDTSEAEAATR